MSEIYNIQIISTRCDFINSDMSAQSNKSLFLSLIIYYNIATLL